MGSEDLDMEPKAEAEAEADKDRRKEADSGIEIAALEASEIRIDLGRHKGTSSDIAEVGLG